MGGIRTKRIKADQRFDNLNAIQVANASFVKHNSSTYLAAGDIVTITTSGTAAYLDVVKAQGKGALARSLRFCATEGREYVRVVSWMRLADVNTAAAAVGDLVYLDDTTPGTWSLTPPPTGTQIVVGKVLVSHASTGVILLDNNVQGDRSDAGTLLVETGTILAAAVAGLFGASVEILAAPGVGYALWVDQIRWILRHNGVDYDAVVALDHLVAIYAAGADVVHSVPGTGFGDASADTQVFAQSVDFVVAPANTAVHASIENSEWWGAAGDGDIEYEILYRIVEA